MNTPPAPPAALRAARNASLNDVGAALVPKSAGRGCGRGLVAGAVLLGAAGIPAAGPSGLTAFVTGAVAGSFIPNLPPLIPPPIPPASFTRVGFILRPADSDVGQPLPTFLRSGLFHALAGSPLTLV